MKILALDPGTNCGFALLDKKSIVSGTWDLSTHRDESRGMRLIRLRNKLKEIGKVDIIVFEVSKNYMSTLGAEVAGEIRGLITTWAHDNKIEYQGVNVSTIKKVATGKGNANKQLMIETANRIFNKNLTDNNEADALLVLDYARKEFNI